MRSLPTEDDARPDERRGGRARRRRLGAPRWGRAARICGALAAVAALSALRTPEASEESAEAGGKPPAASASERPPTTSTSGDRTASARYRGLRLLDLFTLEGGPIVLSGAGAVPRGLTGIAPSDCAGCHAEIAAEWRGSAHARAFTNGVFLAEYLPSAERFCRNCHAPLWSEAAARAGAGGEEDGPALLARGVDCAVCHVRDGHVLGVAGKGDGDHAARRDARLRTSAFCGACHQFDFPAPADGKEVRYHPGEPLQNTLVEWTQSAYAKSSCQECHMPRVTVAPSAGAPDANAKPASGARSYRSHAFRTFEDPALLAGAVKVRATARWRGVATKEVLEVTIAISPGKIGHAFPTGDMFRQARLEVQVGATKQMVWMERIFAPTITENGRGHLLSQVDDTRVLPAKRQAEQRHVLRFEGVGGAATVAGSGAGGDASGSKLRWSLTLFRLNPKVAELRQLPDELVRIPVTAGELELPRRRPATPSPRR